MTENKPIMIDELGCNKCPDKKRCDEQRERKDNIINSMLDDIKDTAIAYHCDLKDKIKNLKQNLPIITRCDVVLEKQLLRKTQECERLKRKLKPKLKNAHCSYFEGQTGLCKVKEFTKCNPINCKLYTIDELSTIVDLQDQLNQLKAKNEQAEQKLKRIKEDITKIKDCATTEMVEIATRKDYNGFLALKGISAKTTQILKIIDEVE